jgi:hypothetical protein
MQRGRALFEEHLVKKREIEMSKSLPPDPGEFAGFVLKHYGDDQLMCEDIIQRLRRLAKGAGGKKGD